MWANNMEEAVTTPLEMDVPKTGSFPWGLEAVEGSGLEHRLWHWITWHQILALPLTRQVT